MEEIPESDWRMPLMGGVMDVAFYDVPEDSAEPYFKYVAAEASRLEMVFNIYDRGSELSRLNMERSIRASKELIEVVKASLGYSRSTDGRYDVSLGRQFLARKRRQPLPEVACSYLDISVRGGDISLTHPDALIDLGSIAKGYIVDKVTDRMKSLGIRGGFVDARGDMRIYGRHLEVVSVQHPRDKAGRLKPIVLENMAVATSGDYNQYDGTYDRSHIIGSRDFISATVVAESAMDADAAATCLCVVGKEGSGRFLERHSSLKAYSIDRDLGQSMYNGYERLLVPQEALHG